MRHIDRRKKNILIVFSLMLLLFATGFVESSDARSRSGGRSLNNNRSYSKNLIPNRVRFHRTAIRVRQRLSLEELARLLVDWQEV